MIAGCWNWTVCSLGCSNPGVQQVSVQNCVGPCSIPAATSSVGSPSRSSPPAHQSIELLTDAHSTPGHTVSSPEKQHVVNYILLLNIKYSIIIPYSLLHYYPYATNRYAILVTILQSEGWHLIEIYL